MRDNERSGVLLALTGFALLSCGDAIVKSMGGAWSPIAVAALRFVIGALVLSALLVHEEGLGAFRPQNLWLQIGRGACLAFASMSFFSALFLMPMADAMAITFVSPIFVALFSGPLLNEKVPPSTWFISALALIGVGVILRPNLLELGPPALLPLLSSVLFSLMVIANRASAGQGSALSMQVFIAVFAAPFLIVAAYVGAQSGEPLLAVPWPSWDIIARCAIVAVTASCAHWLAFMGTQRAGAAIIAPTTYIQLLVVVTLGYLFFDEIPDGLTLVGASIIILAGLLLWRASAKRSAGRPTD
jgi:drug/metabolite transporter (DMT)-like permease